MIDCVDFRIQPLAEHLSSVLDNVFTLLDDVQDDDAKMRVFNTLGIVLQRGKSEVCQTHWVMPVDLVGVCVVEPVAMGGGRRAQGAIS